MSPTGNDLTLEEAAKISGNCSPKHKQRMAYMLVAMSRNEKTFGDSISRNLKLTNVSVLGKAEDQAKLEARIVCELDVQQDMLNSVGGMHGGCSAYLVDICTTMAMMLYEFHVNEENPNLMTVSQGMNLLYHGPASLGEKLRIVSTTITMGTRIFSSNCEIWNATRHRLATTGVHTKMIPSATPKL